MTEREQQLEQQVASLRASPAEAHELIATNTYKYGLLCAATGIPPEMHHLAIVEHLKLHAATIKRLQLIPPTVCVPTSTPTSAAPSSP